MKDPSINEMIRRLQPKAVINNRGFTEGDFDTPERDWFAFVDEDASFSKPVEACQSVGTESWGYRRDEDYYSDRFIMQSIDKIRAKGGNYLLNVGPAASGEIPEEPARILKKVGQWYNSVKESFQGTVPVTLNKGIPRCLLMKKGDKTVAHEILVREYLLSKRDSSLYVHLYEPQTSSRVLLKPLEILPDKAVLLNNGEELQVSVERTPYGYQDGKGYLRIRNIPVNRMENTVMVIRLDFDAEVPEVVCTTLYILTSIYSMMTHLKLRWMEFSGGDSINLIKTVISRQSDVRGKPASNLVNVYLKRLLDMMKTDTGRNQYGMTKLIYAMLVCSLDHHKEFRSDNSAFENVPYIRPVLEYIEYNLDKELNVNRLAKIACLILPILQNCFMPLKILLRPNISLISGYAKQRSSWPTAEYR